MRDVVGNPPHQRTAGPLSRDSPISLESLREIGGREPQFSSEEWAATTDPQLLAATQPLVCGGFDKLTPAIIWKPFVIRRERTVWSNAQLQAVQDLGGVYRSLSKRQRNEAILKLFEEKGLFAHVDVASRESVRRAVTARVQELVLKQAMTAYRTTATDVATDPSSAIAEVAAVAHTLSSDAPGTLIDDTTLAGEESRSEELQKPL